MVPVKKLPPGSLSVNTVGTPTTGGASTPGSTPNIFAAATATPKSMINTTGERARVSVCILKSFFPLHLISVYLSGRTLQHRNQSGHICIHNSDMYHIMQKGDTCSLKCFMHIDCKAIFTIWCHYQKTSSSTSGEIRSKLSSGCCCSDVNAFPPSLF